MELEQRIEDLAKRIVIAKGKGNPCHVKSGPQGGQFCETKGGGSGGSGGNAIMRPAGPMYDTMRTEHIRSGVRFTSNDIARAQEQKLTVANLKAFGPKNLTAVTDASESLKGKQGFSLKRNEGNALVFQHSSGAEVQIIRPYRGGQPTVDHWPPGRKGHEMPNQGDLKFQAGKVVLP